MKTKGDLANSKTVPLVSQAPFVTKIRPSEEYFDVICLSCHTQETSQWYKVSWDLTSEHRLCASCYGQYCRSGSNCNKCHRVYSEAIVRQKGRQELLASGTYESGETVQGYPCDYCDGNIIEQEKKRVTTQSIAAPGVCYICKTQRLDTCWREVPWKTGFQWCGTCRSRYGGTATVCGNEDCLKIPVQGELKLMKLIDLDEGLYECLACGAIAKKDIAKKCRTAKKLEKRQGKCFACGPTYSRRWAALPWDKKFPALVCHTCYLLYRAYSGRCLNMNCRKIFKKCEIAKMQKVRKIPGPDGNLCYPCISCKSMTTVIESV
ncbi:uncharacterized protein TDEL_0B06690 [Torulaspora delbrueckii]|uniref:GATA-type domain-containing protein n=1 Tax=Torulaspora delbrueckii TaxID=4950 RepID=G8ZQA4_TORDE|nr:hypothetical protein TDEL_0B06690 [Torulaspora delbrueckii]CCE90798.1 hypothetical protein TDEL_0B06690 [Torulaspora delbrueckii]